MSYGYKQSLELLKTLGGLKQVEGNKALVLLFQTAPRMIGQYCWLKNIKFISKFTGAIHILKIYR